jgi:hypothetical protein
MSLEQFISPDQQGEGMSEAALEALKERMAAAAAQIAQIKKEEGKQKKKEEELLKILLKFVKTSSKTDLVLLISRVLEQNIPANFILSIIVLSNPEIHQEVGHFKMLDHQQPSADNSSPQKNALVFFSANDETLPLKVKIELDNWIKNLLLQSEENPQKLLKTAYEIEMRELPKEWDFEDAKYERIERIRPVLIQIITSVMREFLEQNDITEPFEKLYDFAKFIITGILNKTKENLDSRKLLQ